jgi:hypothetical protein
MGFMYKMKSIYSFLVCKPSAWMQFNSVSMCEWSMFMLMMLNFQSYNET